MSDELLGETLELVDSLKRELAAAQQRISKLEKQVKAGREWNQLLELELANLRMLNES